MPLVIKKWYWFIIAIAVAVYCSRLYVDHTMPVYRTSATILINETESRPIVDNSEILQGLGLPGGLRNLQNQIMIMKSRDLIESTLKALPFEIEYYYKTLRYKIPIYPEGPIAVIPETEFSFPKDTEFSLQLTGDSTFNVKSEVENFPFQRKAAFGEMLEIPGGRFTVKCRNEKWFNSNNDYTVYFKVHSYTSLIKDYTKRISVEQVSRDGSMLTISLIGTNSAKDEDFLNQHLKGFQFISLDKKNQEAERRIRFIDNQLVGISDSLSITESRLQQFRSSHRVMDLSAQGQSIIGQVTLLENERARLSLEANYYDYLADYLDKDASGEAPIIPITMGIMDPGLTRIVEELADLQAQLAARGAGEMNPLQRNLEQKVRTAKSSLRETLNGLRRANSLARSENQEQINRANSQASSLPVTERMLLGIERKFEINNELYTFLLETRAEQEMQRASNRADSEVIDPADSRFSTLVSPNRVMVGLIAFFAGFAFPLAVIVLRIIFNNKLEEDDVREITNIPIAGRIQHSVKTTRTVVFDDSSSSIAESFRLLRSKIQFFTKNAKSPVILITSSMPGEGKTFVAINLASVYSLLGLKTVLVGFDLRKPAIFDDFGLRNEKGVSTWLIGINEIKEIEQETGFENLTIISAGPVPPNPSELTALGKTNELITSLKERYDYIIIDTSPLGVISDTFYLAAFADTCLMVVRPGITPKDVFEHTLNEISSSEINNVCLLLNDLQFDSKRYDNRGKYGYLIDKQRSKGLSFKRKA